jgi:hypothetical protein
LAPFPKLKVAATPARLTAATFGIDCGFTVVIEATLHLST